MISPQAIEFIFQTFQKNNPEPKTELNYQTNYQLLVAVILSAQARDKMVNLVTLELFKLVRTPQDMTKLTYPKLVKILAPLGLYQTKAKNLLKGASLIVENFNSKVPAERKDLLTIPGVGHKTASVILNELFGQATIAVDTHVLRVSNRLGLINEKNPEKSEAKLIKVVPSWAAKNAHHWLILHGRYICKALSPNCSECRLLRYCKYPCQEKK